MMMIIIGDVYFAIMLVYLNVLDLGCKSLFMYN
jgi:hypothetical protein